MRPANLQLGLQVGKREAGVLEIEDRFAERLAIAAKFDGFVECLLCAGLCRYRNRQPFLRQFAHQIDKAHAFLAQAIGHRYADILKE